MQNCKLRKGLVIAVIVLFGVTIHPVISGDNLYIDATGDMLIQNKDNIASDSVEDRINDLISNMTLKEKIDQMSLYKSPLGAIISFAMPNAGAGHINKRLGIPPLWVTGSSRGATLYSTAFPVSMCRGASWDISLEYRINEAIGIEAKAVGANVVYAPMINIVRHPGWGRSQESYGEDTYHMSKLGVAAIMGLQNHVMSQVKAFALYSIEEDRLDINVKVDERTLREVYLPHFKAAVQEADVASVMSSYNKVNGQYVSENKHLLQDILKDEWGFDGFVASDWWACKSTAGSVLAGLDIEAPNPIFYGKTLLEAVERDDVPEMVIDDAVSRILRKKLTFGLFEKKPENVDKAFHRELALEVARKGIVLLKNDNEALPIERNGVRRVAVIGRHANRPRLGDFGSSMVLPIRAVTPLAGIKNKADGVYVTSYTGRLTYLAKLHAMAADVAVVVVALTAFDEGEWVFPGLPFGGDREHLGLAPCDVEMINAVAEVNDRVVVVIEAGGAITMGDWIDNVDAIVMSWYPGVEGGNAIAEVLYGDINPSGKLPLTFPKTDDQLYTFGTKQPEVEYGYYHGYRYFDKYDLQPQFPFGFGLSYTNYEYSNLQLSDSSMDVNDTLIVSFDITNIGDVAGEEISQLYIGYKGSKVDRAVYDLKGFDKVHLEPGEVKTVCVNISAEDLAYYDIDSSKWVVEPITYSVHVGPSSRLLPLQAEFNIGR